MTLTRLSFLVAALALLLLGQATHAQYVVATDTSYRKVDRELIYGPRLLVRTFTNTSSSPQSYRYSIQKTYCRSWSVSLSVLDRYRLAAGRLGCFSNGSYSVDYTVLPGYTARTERRSVDEYTSYALYTYEVLSDGSDRLIDTRYAMKHEAYPVYGSSLRR